MMANHRCIIHSSSIIFRFGGNSVIKVMSLTCFDRGPASPAVVALDNRELLGEDS